MKRLLATLVLLAATAALADEMVALHRGALVRLTVEPCPADIPAPMDAASRAQLQAAYVRIAGRDWRACWTLTQHADVILFYEDGDQGLIPGRAFHLSPTI